MKWFRRHIKTGSRLALFALAIQFALSFGHFHVDVANAAPVIQSQSDLADANGLAVEAASQTQHQNDSHDTDHHPGVMCAICAVASMAQQMVFATPALLWLPDALELLYLVTDAELAHLSESWPGFQSRAPPVS